MSDVIYEKKKFCIPVTKAEPFEAIQFIVEDFCNKGISFCVDGVDEQWEIWRMEEPGDIPNIKKKDMPVSPKYLYVNGKLVEKFLTK